MDIIKKDTKNLGYPKKKSMKFGLILKYKKTKIYYQMKTLPYFKQVVIKLRTKIGITAHQTKMQKLSLNKTFIKEYKNTKTQSMTLLNQIINFKIKIPLMLRKSLKFKQNILYRMSFSC